MSAADRRDQRDQALDDQGRAAMARGDYEEALRYFKEAYDDSELERFAKYYRKDIAWAESSIHYEAIHKQAVDAWNRRDYAEALRLFTEQQKLRNGPNVRKSITDLKAQMAAADRAAKKQARAGQKAAQENEELQLAAERGKVTADLAHAQQAQRDSEAAAAENQRREQDAANMRQSALTQGIAAAPPSAVLVFKGQTQTGEMGTSQSSPQLEFKAGAQPVAVRDTSGQLASAANSGVAANAKAIGDQPTKVNSNCAFDTLACAPYSPVSVPAITGQSPGTREIVARIPGPGRNDPVIRQSVAYYEKLDGLKIDTQTKLQAVQREIDGGTGNATVLNARKSTLSDDLRRYVADQASTRNQIQDRLVKIGLKWDESPAPAPGTSAKP